MDSLETLTNLTAVSSKGELNIVIFVFFAKLKVLCHEYGV